MKKNLFKIFVSMLLLSSISVSSIYANSNNLKFNKSELIISKDNIQPRWSWSGNVYLDDSNYCNITTYNNLFNDTPKVTNDALNMGSITVRAVNESGKIVCSPITVKLGETMKLDKIGAFEGKVTFQAKANIRGSYRISLT